MEIELDFSWDFHGSTGPVLVCRYPRSEWFPYALSFEQACLAEGFAADEDQNHPESTGVSPRVKNTIDGVLISMAIAYLNPVRHRMNLTIKGDVLARRILFEGKKLWWGSERFTVEGEQIVLCSGAICSPQLFMLSGIGPAEHLKFMGIELVHESLGVGQSLREHRSAVVLFRATGDRPEVQVPVIQVGLRYTVEGSTMRNDKQISPMLMTSEHRPAHVQIDDEKYIGFNASLQPALGCGELRLTANDPSVQPYLDYNYLIEPLDWERLRKAIRLVLRMAEHSSFKDSSQAALTQLRRT